MPGLEMANVRVRFPKDQESEFNSLYREFRKLRFGTDHGIEGTRVLSGENWEVCVELEFYEFTLKHASASCAIVELVDDQGEDFKKPQ